MTTERGHSCPRPSSARGQECPLSFSRLPRGRVWRLAEVERERPDFVMHTGDFIDNDVLGSVAGAFDKMHERRGGVGVRSWGELGWHLTLPCPTRMDKG